MDEKLNFAHIAALIVDSDQYSNGILSQILRGFALNKHTIVEHGEEAKQKLLNGHYDLMICEAALPDMPSAELIHWIRRLPNPAIKYISIIVLTGYTQLSNVVAVRDNGANSVVSKPFAPNALFDHIAWSAKSSRPFIETENYVGPCRRFKNIGPPSGAGRRSTDLSPEIGAAQEPNMSQDEIDSLLRPTKIAIT